MNKEKFQEFIKDLNQKQTHTGSTWTESTCYLERLNKIIWGDILNNRMLSFDSDKVEIFRSPSNFSNGNTSYYQGNLITCEHGAGRVTRTDKNNVISLIADEYK
jgi:gluconolactonase